ncbi:MAG: ABC transporter ATP-binding protein [Candidatus Saccharibacteria bacterium]|nr:ABC transporter ATP-binding protein [Candidatus Saccharibacteria bacterium]
MFRMVRYLKPYFWQSLLLVLSIAVQSWTTLQLPTYMSQIINNGIMANGGTGDYGFIFTTGAKMLVTALISAGCAVLSSFLSAKIGSAVGRDIRNEFFSKVIAFSINEIDDFSTASLITRTTNDIATVQQTLIMMLSMMLRAPLMATIAIINAVFLAPDMTWIIALAVVIMLTLTISIMAVVIPKFKIYQMLEDRINLETRESLTGLRVIRAFNNQKREEKKFSKTNEKLRKLDVFASTLLSLQSPLMMLIFNGTSIAVIWIGINNITVDPTYLGKMIAFMQYATQVIMSFMFLTIIFVMLPRASVSANRVNDVLKKHVSIKWKKKMAEEVGAPKIEFKHVDFAYGEAEEKVLKDISFVAEAGKTTAFIGSTGSGKSTLINLISRMHDVTGGEVMVNGVDVRNYTKDELISRIGLVPQRAFLFSGTVKSNILFGVNTKDYTEVELDKRMRKAAEIAQAKEFVEKLPEKYNAPISEGGTNVSGGQRQRLSIARAIAKEPEIYIFDDAFSALDMKTDKKLREALEPVTKKAVTVIVAQRISTIKNADQIIVLDKGKMVGRGTHLELLADCEVYREITKSQLSDQEFAAEMKLAGRAK